MKTSTRRNPRPALLSRLGRYAGLCAQLTSLGCLGACLAPVAVPDQKVAFHVTSDPGKPLEGARILLDERELAKTGPDGVALVSFHAAIGNVVRVAVRCPQGHTSPTDAISVGLRGVVGEGKRPEYEVSCPPTARSFVVAVRADNGANLPVLYEGQEVSRTDASGAAHVLVSAAPGEQFALTLGTDEKNAAHLRPHNPTVTFVAGDRDEILTMEERFVDDAAPAPVVHRKHADGPVKVDGPIRIVSRREGAT
jgi:hypothetical protein